MRMLEEEDFYPVPKPKHQKRKRPPKNIPSKTRKYVKQRDDYKCVRCGSPKSLQLHHLITKGRYDQSLYNLEHVHDPRNLVCVCAGCHRQIHDVAEVMDEMLAYQVERFGEVRKHGGD